MPELEEQYPLGPDSERQEDVPRGSLKQGTWAGQTFPGTVRDYWVYVPAQYTANKPACVMVFQDGGGFVDTDSRWQAPIVLDNLIARGEMPVTIGVFVNPGVLPAVQDGLAARVNRSIEYDSVSDRYARFLLDELLPEVGREYRLSEDPNDRALCGVSSGGICAFTTAWFRPDAFRRVLTFVGSFTNLRGGDVYPSLIRKSEPRPLRVFLQSGTHDMNTYAGSWYLANQQMMASLAYMGYDAKLVLGDGGHDTVQAASIFPDALRWLWRDYPQPIATPLPTPDREWATDILEPGSEWEPAEGEYPATPRGRQLSPDRSLVATTDTSGRHAWSFQVQADGSLAHGEPFYRLEVDESATVAVDGVAVDSEGYFYFATRLGFQVCDLEGRVAFVIAPPPGGPAQQLAFGGPDLRTLYATAGDKIFQRRLRRSGVRQEEEP